MEWEIEVKHPAISQAYEAYRDFVLGAATQYAGARLLEQIDLSALDTELPLALSDMSSESFTTIRTIGQLSDSITEGHYAQLCIRQATVQLCTAFESFYNSVCLIFQLPESAMVKSIPAYCRTLSPNPFDLGNKTIRQIRSLHEHLKLDSVLNDDQVLIKLSAIIEVRNCVVHSGGRVTTQKQIDRLKTYGFRVQCGDLLTLKDKLFDDFLHYMAIHTKAFVRCLPDA